MGWDVTSTRVMKMLVKIIVGTVLILVAVLVISIIALHSYYIFMRMPTNTMQPLITTNDIVVAAKHFDLASLRNGDLVVVALPVGIDSVLTVRKIEQQTNTPAGQFYLVAASTNGIDSRLVGPVPAADLRGKVTQIVRGR